MKTTTREYEGHKEEHSMSRGWNLGDRGHATQQKHWVAQERRWGVLTGMLNLLLPCDKAAE